MVARLSGRERNPSDRTPPAHTPTLIGYTTSRDAIFQTAHKGLIRWAVDGT
jgi:hypothetical protein